MTQLSEHMSHKPYQVATTLDPAQPHRKWCHMGTIHASSSASAAYAAARPSGDIVSESPAHGGIVYRFRDGLCVCVKF